MKKLQQDWKAIGVTQKKEGDRVWSEFRSACDHFFQRMKEDRKAYKAKQKDLAAQKMAAVEELKALVGDEKKLSKKTLLDAAKKYRSLGRLGRDFQKTEDLFEETLQQGFDKLKMDRMEASKVQFEQKLESLNAQGDQRGIERNVSSSEGNSTRHRRKYSSSRTTSSSSVQGRAPIHSSHRWRKRSAGKKKRSNHCGPNSEA